jgi:hypothetical protein
VLCGAAPGALLLRMYHDTLWVAVSPAARKEAVTWAIRIALDNALAEIRADAKRLGVAG